MAVGIRGSPPSLGHVAGGESPFGDWALLPRDAMSRSPDLDLVIPALNEAYRIGATLESIGDRLEDSPYTARITVVDNGSVDRTVETVDGSSIKHPQVRVISCSAKGKGAAVRTGIGRATAPFVGYVDADLSVLANDVVAGLEILSSGWDVVVGSRRAVGAEYVVPQPILRRMGSRAFNLAASTIVGGLSDTQCGLKLFRTAAIQGIFEQTRVDGFAFDVEVLARAQAAHLRIIELPVTWADSPDSSLRPMRDGLRAFEDLYRVRRRLSASCAQPIGSAPRAWDADPHAASHSAGGRLIEVESDVRNH